jgi:predicted nucleic acid-binding protein
VPARIADRLRDAVPEQIYWDTSFVVDALLKPPDKASSRAHLRHREAVNLLARLEGKKPRVVISSLLFSEFWEAVLKIELKAAHGDEYYLKLKADPGIVLPCITRIREADERLTELLGKFSNVFTVHPAKDVHTRALDLMGKHPLRPFDAIHIASRVSQGVTDFAVSDKHFEVLEGFTIWRNW